MNTTDVKQIPEPLQRMNKFREWLDSLGSDGLQEIDIRPIKSLLNGLVCEGSVLPAGYCQMLGMPEGRTYAQAVVHVRYLFAERMGIVPVLKPYRVTLRANVEVEIDVDAISEADAEVKAWEWRPDYEGSCKVGLYTLNDDDFCDDGEMCWEIVDHEIKDTVSVQELDDVDDDAEA